MSNQENTAAPEFDLSHPGLNDAYALALAVINGDPEALAKAQRLKASLEEMEKEIEVYAAQIDEANTEFADDDIQIDGSPVVSAGDEGVWISAWVYVEFPDTCEDDENEEEEEEEEEST